MYIQKAEEKHHIHRKHLASVPRPPFIRIIMVHVIIVQGGKHLKSRMFVEIERPCVGTFHQNGCDLKNNRQKIVLRSTNEMFNYVIVHRIFPFSTSYIHTHVRRLGKHHINTDVVGIEKLAFTKMKE